MASNQFVHPLLKVVVRITFAEHTIEAVVNIVRILVKQRVVLMTV